MHFTTCRFEYLTDTRERRCRTALFPGFVSPVDRRVTEYFVRVHPTWAVLEFRNTLLDFTEEETCASFKDFYLYWKKCRRCSLADSKKKKAFYRGALDAPIVFVGEAPGSEENRYGLPFVGRSGEFLDALVALLGLKEGDFVVANPILCRPTGAENRDRKPTPEEIAACVQHLYQFFLRVRPGGVILLGSTARYVFSVDAAEWETAFTLPNGVQTALIYHPAWYLRQGANPKDCRKALKAARKVIKSYRRKPARTWASILAPNITRAIKYCRADTVFGEGA